MVGRGEEFHEFSSLVGLDRLFFYYLEQDYWHAVDPVDGRLSEIN